MTPRKLGDFRLAKSNRFRKGFSPLAQGASIKVLRCWECLKKINGQICFEFIFSCSMGKPLEDSLDLEERVVAWIFKGSRILRKDCGYIIFPYNHRLQCNVYICILYI